MYWNSTVVMVGTTLSETIVKSHSKHLMWRILWYVNSTSTESLPLLVLFYVCYIAQ